MPFGYLAVLLAYLGLDAKIKRALKTRLQTRYGQLVTAAEAFLLYHRKLPLNSDKVDHQAPDTVFIDKIQIAVDRLKD